MLGQHAVTGCILDLEAAGAAHLADGGHVAQLLQGESGQQRLQDGGEYTAPTAGAPVLKKGQEFVADVGVWTS